jgi:anaerobic magnesium-protoporphyrin IX monomethyl ester cyclase
MDILLTHGYFLYQDPHELQIMKPYPPLGILYISSYLKQQGFDVSVFDTTFSSMDAFQAYIKKERPSIVGIYTNMMTKRNVLQMVDFLKEQKIYIVLGGPDPPHYAAEYLQHGADIVVIGEGEITLAELIPYLAKHGLSGLGTIKGIAWLDDAGKLVENEPRPMIADLSSHPWADREAIDIEHYMRVWKEHHGMSSVSVIQARGCPYTCTWCSHSVFGNTHRRRTPEDAANELLWIKERYNPDLIWYADDVLTINHRWWYAYADELEKRGVRIPFEGISRADRLDEKMVQKLAEMGCYRLWNGSESGSQKILDAMKRKVEVTDVQSKTHLLQKYGIEAGMFIMLGYHDETIDDIADTVEHLKICNPDVFLTTVAYPIKGTPYYAEVETDVLRNGNWAENADRDLTVAGRYSKRFYSFATRWMVNEVTLNKARKSGSVSPIRMAKMWLNTKIGRIGMELTKGEHEATGERVHLPQTQTIGLQEIRS